VTDILVVLKPSHVKSGMKKEIAMRLIDNYCPKCKVPYAWSLKNM